MEVLLDIIRSFDFDILYEISTHLRGGISDTFWKFFSLIGNAGAVWIVLAIALLCFRKTRRAGAAMLVALLIGVLIGNVWLKEWIMRPRPFVTHPELTALLDPGDQWSFPSGHTLSSFAPQIRCACLHSGGADCFLPALCQRALPDGCTGRCAAGYSVRSCRCMADRSHHRPHSYHPAEKGCLNESV